MRILRYQGAIIRDHHILLIKHTELTPNELITRDPISYPLMQRIQAALGYPRPQDDAVN
jgi:hypothetical protein